jgi:hypothetical protein
VRRNDVDVLIFAVFAASNILCFIVGAKVGQAVKTGKEVKLPEVNPVKAYKEHKVRKEQEKERDRMDIIMQNIERYDGTSNGQVDVPKG